MSLVGAFTDLKKYVKPKTATDVSTVIFKLHRLTCSFLLCCSLLTTSRQFFGAPIHCTLGDSPQANIPIPVFESYCFMRATYSHQHILNESSTHRYDHAQPGVSAGEYGVKTDVTYHNYYQWVCLLFVIQAAICYAPWSYWKSVERGRLGKLLERVSKDPLTEKPLKEQVSGLGDFIINNSGWFNGCAFKLVLSQLVCLVLTILQLYLMDVVLDYQFLHLGKHIFTVQQLSVALYRVFPLVVACDMAVFGHTGEVVWVDGLCTLPINIINEKIYLILWVWYIILILTSIVLLTWEALHVLCPQLRLVSLHRMVKRTPATGRMVRLVNKHSSYGDFVMLTFIAKNIDSSQFEVLIHHLYENSESTLPLHHRSLPGHSDSVLEPEPFHPMQRIQPCEKSLRGKEL